MGEIVLGFLRDYWWAAVGGGITLFAACAVASRREIDFIGAVDYQPEKYLKK